MAMSMHAAFIIPREAKGGLIMAWRRSTARAWSLLGREFRPSATYGLCEMAPVVCTCAATAETPAPPLSRAACTRNSRPASRAAWATLPTPQHLPRHNELLKLKGGPRSFPTHKLQKHHLYTLLGWACLILTTDQN
jgi:hypothetical protein